MSGAFDQWKSSRAAIVAFLTLTRRWADAAYDKEWVKAREDFEKIFDPDRDDPEAYVDLFLDRVDGLWTRDFMWMLRAAILRDAVTAFDVTSSRDSTSLFTERHGCRSVLIQRPGARIGVGHGRGRSVSSG